MHLVDEHHAYGTIRGHVHWMRELPNALAQAKPDDWLSMPLEATYRQRQEFPIRLHLLKAVESPHGPHAESNRDCGVHQVSGCDQEDEDVRFVDQLALPEALLSVRAWIFSTCCR
jgi:hypothetical protein